MGHSRAQPKKGTWAHPRTCSSFRLTLCCIIDCFIHLLFALSFLLSPSQNQLSGNLLRKFKNSNGWQKLWVVFTNFSLFFYKSHQDDYPLASLPLLGYSVTVPSESENIHKDYVFKLHFKSHVYYFRSESEYTFERWVYSNRGK
ncbi:FERM, ARHGEF and pleckstrin domain-containing protein 1-like [Haplochromis burtoni]|uniref:FERM, ARHGEF and pleckstrin domain-containing protein 1-like n=1 Tax=Haplochromis burtoni TaxID=8153 RepID=UPI001C2CE10F|nr:FERM, ARHGEF and pleckstrin domain-containing protein 1-like [Haplochromis burtoni]